MSYDLEVLHQKSAMNIASLVFTSGTELAGTSFIPSSLNNQVIIHQIYFQASGFATCQMGRATAAASGYWSAMGTQTPSVEPTRIVVDAASGVFLSGANGLGNGMIRAWYTTQRATGQTPGTL